MTGFASFLKALPSTFLFGVISTTVSSIGLSKRSYATKSTLDLSECALRSNARTIGEPDALNPTVRALNFSVPAIGGVVRHLVLQVLTEAKTVGVDANLNEEQVASSNEITQGFVRDDALAHGLAHSHRNGFFTSPSCASWLKS